MPDGALALEIVVFSFAWWLGLYLLARDPSKRVLRLAGLGLLAYAAGLAADVLSGFAPVESSTALQRLMWPLLFLPALCWSGTLVYLLPDEATLRVPLQKAWAYVALPLAAALIALGWLSDWVVDLTGGSARPGPGYALFALAVLLPLLSGLGLLLAGVPSGRDARARPAFGLLAAATLFFALGGGLLLVPLGVLPRVWVVLAIGGDLAVLGFVIAVLDALDAGETLLPDMSRSLAAAAATAALFGLQVLLAMALGGGPSFALVALLLTILAAAIAVQTWNAYLQAGLDRVVFARAPRLQQARAEQRAVEMVLPRVDEALDLARLDDEEFARLTRRALSHYGDLPRLASNPLTRLPAIDARLTARGAADQPLERALELKHLLAESIARLKPRGQGDFGSSDEWRYYNALYFPYVAGLKPYSRRAEQSPADAAAREALAWLRQSVPERTLYNWQTAAARLVAQDLRAAPPGPAGEALARGVLRAGQH